MLWFRSAFRWVLLSILFALGFLLALSQPAHGAVLSPLRIPDSAVGSRCFGQLPCTDIDPFGIRLRLGVMAYFRPERQHDRDFYAARLMITPSVTLFQWAEIGIAIPITLYKKEIGVFTAYEPLQPFGRVRIPIEKILGGISLTSYVRIHLARFPFVSGLPPVASEEGQPLSLMAEALIAYQKQSAFEAGLVAQKRVGPVTFSAAFSASIGPERAEVSGGGELAYHWKTLHAFVQGRGLGVPQCPPAEAALGFCARGFQFLTGVRLDLDLGPGALAIGTGSGAVEPGWVVGAQVGLDYEEKVRQMHGDGVEAAHRWWERRFEAMARGWAAWKSAALVSDDEAEAARRARHPQRGPFSALLGPAAPPPSSPWLDQLLGEDTLPGTLLLPPIPSEAQLSGLGSSPLTAQGAKAKSIRRRPLRRNLFAEANARAALERQLVRQPQFALPGTLELMTDEELARQQWQVAREELRRAEQQQWRDSPDLPPVSKALLNGLTRVPYGVLSPFFMGSPDGAAQVAEIWERLRPLKYTPEEQKLGETMEEIVGMAGEIAATAGAGALLEAETAGSRVAMRAAAREAAKRAGRQAAYEAAEQAALSTGESTVTGAVELGGSSLSQFFASVGERLNPLNYEIRGLGSNFGNLRFKPRSAAASATSAEAMETIAEHEVPAVLPRRSPTSGETPAAARGRQVHKEWNPGEGYRLNRALPSGKRPDAVHWEKREVIELKPDTPRAIRRGERQVEEYRKELESLTGDPWNARVETYKP